MPAHDRVGRDDRRDAVEESSTELLALGCKSSALVVVQSELAALELLLQYAVLFDEVLDGLLLLSMDPT